MTFGAPESSGPPARAVVWLLISSFGLAASITLVWLGMRAVMDIGGACADGGPYVSAQSCPEGVPLLMMLGIFALFGFGALGFWAGAHVGGPWIGLPLLAWPGLFLSLGWNFLEYGVSPPEDFGTGPELGWLIPGVMFILMGGVPLLVAWRARAMISSAGDATIASRLGIPSVGARSARHAPSPSIAWDPSHRTADSGPVAASATSPATGDGETGDLVDRLERLARLRRAGDLTNAEYEAAKATLLGPSGEGS
jgi:hypothetical protein